MGLLSTLQPNVSRDAVADREPLGGFSLFMMMIAPPGLILLRNVDNKSCRVEEGRSMSVRKATATSKGLYG